MHNVWRHIPTQTTWAYIGEDRNLRDEAFAVLQSTEDDTLKARVDVLDLFKKEGHWEKLD